MSAGYGNHGEPQPKLLQNWYSDVWICVHSKEATLHSFMACTAFNTNYCLASNIFDMIELFKSTSHMRTRHGPSEEECSKMLQILLIEKKAQGKPSPPTPLLLSSCSVQVLTLAAQYCTFDSQESGVLR